jgi:hypothetical protein
MEIVRTWSDLINSVTVAGHMSHYCEIVFECVCVCSSFGC